MVPVVAASARRVPYGLGSGQAKAPSGPRVGFLAERFSGFRHAGRKNAASPHGRRAVTLRRSSSSSRSAPSCRPQFRGFAARAARRRARSRAVFFQKMLGEKVRARFKRQAAQFQASPAPRRRAGRRGGRGGTAGASPAGEKESRGPLGLGPKERPIRGRRGRTTGPTERSRPSRLKKARPRLRQVSRLPE